MEELPLLLDGYRLFLLLVPLPLHLVLVHLLFSEQQLEAELAHHQLRCARDVREPLHGLLSVHPSGTDTP